MAIEKSINDINESDLVSLITNSVRESKKLDYKKELIGDTREDKKEFLADISSFANALGGYIIFGIEEEGGVAKSLSGINIQDCDAEILRLDNLIRDGIEPRIFGVSIKPLLLSNSNYAILIYIPNSWSKPHVVDYNKHWRFYSRNSAGKNPLDYSEVKTLFFSSEGMTSKIRDFVLNRIGNILAGETPIELELIKKSYIILHVIPVNAFDVKSKYNFSDLINDLNFVKPMNSRGYNHRINFDGLLTYTPQGQSYTKAYTYLQLIKNGIVEAVDMSSLTVKDKEIYGIPSAFLRQEINNTVKRILNLYKKYEIQPPYLVFLNLMGVKGYKIIADPSRFIWMDNRLIDRDNLLIPEILLEDYECNINESLNFIFDSIWNAAGWEKALE